MYKALIIDDEKPVRIAISKLGTWSRFHLDIPACAENGKQALTLMRELSPSIVFVDMSMPVMDGVEFLKHATQECGRCAFIVISGYDDFRYAQQAIHFHVSDYLLKPVVADELNKAIEHAMKTLFPDEDFSGEDSVSSLTAQQVVTLLHDTIDRDYTHNIRLSEFADRYFFSHEYLSRLFKSTYHLGISEYLTSVRMERAASLLKDPAIRITEIASRVGYPDNTYFSKAFRNYFGVSPSEYRSRS